MDFFAIHRNDLQGSFFLQDLTEKATLGGYKKKQGQTYHETVPHFNSLNAQFFFYMCLVKLRMQIRY